MDKVLGIVAEYNPFHNGHLYHLEESKKLTGCNFTIAIVSGNFSQRGNTSLIDKWSKAKMAILAGVDLVIELPTIYSISSAENFASGAIKILNSLNCVDYISFGAETSNLNLLKSIASIFCNEPEGYKNILAEELKKGSSFPCARQNALVNYLKNTTEDLNDILSSPNNILAIEYLKSLEKQNSKIKPILVKRYKTGYNDISFNEGFASASAIRETILNGNINTLNTVMPKNSFVTLLDLYSNGQLVYDLSAFEKEIIYLLRKMSHKEIANLPDVSEGLEFSIKKASNMCNNISDFIDIVKSKRYTRTRLNRILLYSLLGFSKEDMTLSKEIIPYVRVLGFNENGKFLLSKIAKSNPDLPIITSVKNFINSCNNEKYLYLLNKDILATNIYTLAYKNNSLR